MNSKPRYWRPDGSAENCLNNIITHLDWLLNEEQKAAINWHDKQSVSLAVMRVISEWNNTLEIHRLQLEQDSAWRRRWHDRLGRGKVEPEGKFYERIETCLREQSTT